MKRNDVLTLITSVLVIGCLPGLSVALDGNSDSGFRALESQPSGTGSVNYANISGISGGGSSNRTSPGNPGKGFHWQEKTAPGLIAQAAAGSGK